MSSSRLKRFLAVVLAVGNFLNEGTGSGGAKAITLDSVLNLVNVRCVRSICNEASGSTGIGMPDATLHAVKESWCRMVGGKGRRGISFAWRQHRFFFDDFLLLTLSYEKLEETGKGKE